ncbi:MAG TPA: hypothetical protein VI566_15760 [Xanthomonadales bacterium]|nr:hypothetical protein [Xanthomonadales bacterium]
MYKRFVSVLRCLSLLLAFSAAVQAQENAWPRTLSLENGSVTIYPLRVDELDGDLIRFRAALAYRETGATEPVFGAGWFESRVEIDHENGIVHPIDIKVSDTRFPAGTDDVQDELTAVFAQQAPGWSLDFPLTELQSALVAVEQEAKTAQSLNTTPPTIIYRDHPALLVNIDGNPVFRSIEKTSYQAVINTPYPLIFDGNVFYLNAAQGAWYRADSATGPYRFDSSPPADIVAMVEAVAKTEASQVIAEKVTATNAPEIVVATTPSELIVTAGPAEFVPLVDDLLVLDNSADDVFMHISSQQYYVVLAGRWYHSASLNGPWAYRAADDLPLAFTNIPGNSAQADSRVHVAGTDEAQEAVLDAQIPVTAAVARGSVDMEVAYDGEPRFEPVQGTDLSYANNTGSTVIESDRVYYLVEDGVWYVSVSPNGPWEVSDYRPEEVAAISPRSPVYHVKYVYIYDSTPEVVYVGYTPGYVGSYVYYDTIVYGTGWYYRPWVSPYYYYPRYSTWGFNVGYSPWYGWNFGLSWGWGPFYAGFYSGGYWHHNHHWNYPGYGYWGPGGYRPRWGHHDYYGHGRGGYGRGGYYRDGDGWDGNDGRDGDSWGGHDDRDGDGRYVSGRTGSGQYAADATSSTAYVRNQNLYRDRAQRARIAETGDFTRGTRAAGRDLATLAATPAGRQGNLNRADRGGSGRDETGLDRTGPVTASAITSSDLRAKAQIRDARRAAVQDRRVANNNPSGRRMNQAPLERGAASAWENASATGEVRRSQAAPWASGQNSRRRVTEQIALAQPRLSAPAQRDQAALQPSTGTARAPSTAQRQDNSAAELQQRNSRPVEQQRRTPAEPTRQVTAAPGSTPTASVSRQWASRGIAQPGSTPQRSMQQRSAPQQSAPQRVTQQRSAPQQHSAPQQRSTPQQSAPQRVTQQHSAPQQRSAPQQHSSADRSTWQASASSQGGGRESSHSDRSGGNTARRGDRGNSGKH